MKPSKSLRDLSLNIPEKEYHALPAWSYSLIAKYAREGFSSLASIHQPSVSTASMAFGSMFDCMLTRPEDFDSEYAVMTSTAPDAEKKVLDCLATSNKSFDALSKEEIQAAFDQCSYRGNWGFDKKVEKISEYKDYYTTVSSGKTVVSEDEYNDALEMRDAFRRDTYLSALFGSTSSDDVEYLYQTQFKVKYTPSNGKSVFLKIMPDLLVVNHKDRTVQPVDLKTSSMPAYDFAENFVKFRYDIQASLYTDVLRAVLASEDEYKDYTVLTYLFTDISREDKVPVVYSYDTTGEQADGLFFGTDKQYKYKGWRELLDEIASYEDANAVVPSYIKLSCPNNIIDILNNRR